LGELPRTGATKPDSSVAAGAALRLAGFPCFGRHDTTPSYVSGTTFRAKYRQTTAYAATTAFKRPSSGVDPARYSTLFTDVRQPFSRQSRARPEMHFKHPEKARAAIQKADTLPLRP
jgi:hypothetical protein